MLRRFLVGRQGVLLTPVHQVERHGILLTDERFLLPVRLSRRNKNKKPAREDSRDFYFDSLQITVTDYFILVIIHYISNNLSATFPTWFG